MVSILQAALRRRGVLIAVWVLIAGGVVVVTALTTPLYRSEGKLLVRLGRENATLDPTAAIGQGTIITPSSSREFELNSLVEILRSRELAQEVIDLLGPEYFLGKPQSARRSAGSTPAVGDGSSLGDYVALLDPSEPTTPREKAIKVFSTRLVVANTKKSNIISVSFEAPAPEKAQRIVQTLIDTYLNHHGRINRTPGSHEFLVERAGELRNRLTAAEEQLRQQKNSASLASIEERRLLLERRLGGLQDQVFAAEVAGTKTTDLERQSDKTREAIVALNDRALQIARLEREVAILEASDKHLAGSLEQTRLDQAWQAKQLSNVSLAQEPTLEPRVTRPRKLFNYACGCLFATLASVALVTLLEMRNPRVISPDQVGAAIAPPGH